MAPLIDWTEARIDAYTADLLTSLKRSADFLAAQKSFSFQTDIAFDVVQANGQVLEFGGTRDYLMRRPDRLRIESVDADGACCTPRQKAPTGSACC